MQLFCHTSLRHIWETADQGNDFISIFLAKYAHWKAKIKEKIVKANDKVVDRGGNSVKNKFNSLFFTRRFVSARCKAINGLPQSRLCPKRGVYIPSRAAQK